jgi:hypothetical protein
MPDYKLYCMDGLGKRGYVEPLEARNDDEAIRLAYAKKLPLTAKFGMATAS